MAEITKQISSIKLAPLKEIKDLNASGDEPVRFRGFLDSSSGMKTTTFMVVRDCLETVQCIHTLPSDATEEVAALFKEHKKMSIETYLEVTGKIKRVSSAIKKCTKKDFEIEVTRIEVLGKVYGKLPFLKKDVTDMSSSTVGYNVRLDNRTLDFRMPATHAMVRVIDQTMFSFRRILRERDFIEIKTSKIIQSGSEGGANMFSVDYFDKKAYLAQSPQLYKQLCVLGGMKRVYEVGHVYRAEVSNINRYLSEFTGLDIEMELETDFIGFIKFVHSVFVGIFESLKSDTAAELEIIRKYSPFDDVAYKNEPVVLTHSECVKMLREAGEEVGEKDDFSRKQEKTLGGLVKQKHGVDLFVCVGYPVEVRAFYTYAEEDGTTRSYDFILNGEEVLSGAQRQTDYEKLKVAIQKKGISLSSLDSYLEPFKYGAPPHIGCGIGLERLLKAFFSQCDIRHFSLFPRDPNRLTP
ncbi:SYDC [Enterospora canceri]|uniref:aspartate--tRNA ligase n=1 Tax=Enterospora canceri TaxID=1081671 RepID=A0A1Y1S7Q9_9MICR|nr:SYDC [Enterospora canceri]